MKACIERLIKYDSDNKEKIDSFYRMSIGRAEGALKRSEAELSLFDRNARISLKDIINNAFKVQQKD